MIACLIIVLIILTLQSPYPAWSQAARGWAIRAVSNYRGSQTIYFTPTVARIESRDLGAICRADGYVVLYNPSTRTYMNLTHKDFITKFGLTLDPRRLSIKKGESSTVFGLRATKYTVTVTNSKGATDVTDTLWTTEDFQVARSLEDDCAAVLGIPSGIGVPLKMSRTYPTGVTNTFLDTLSCAPAGFTREHFQLGSAYTPAKDETELLMGRDSVSGSARANALRRTR